ncbi:MAG: MFS transporter [Gaiellaceae bacterium]
MDPPGWRTKLGPLEEPRFRLLFVGRTVSLFGSAIAPIALAFAVLDLSHSATALGVVLGARMVPMVLFALVGGVWADRLPRHLVMTGSNVLSGVAQAATAAVLLCGVAQVWELVVLQVVGGTASAFFMPAQAGAVPQTVKEENLRQANALLGLSAAGTRIGGAALGGIVVAVVGAGWGLAIDAVTFLAAAAFLVQLRLEPVARPARPSFARELVEGWTEFRSRSWLWAISSQFALVNAVGMSCLLVLGPIVSKESFNGPVSWGLIDAGLAGGLVAGGVAALKLRPRRPLLSAPVAGLALVPVLALLAVGWSPLLVVAAALVYGVALAVFEALYMTELQNEIPHDKLSRVMSYDLLASFAFIPIGAPLVGAAATWIGVREMLWFGAAVVLGASVAPLAFDSIRRSRRAVDVSDAEPSLA